MTSSSGEKHDLAPQLLLSCLQFSQTQLWR